MKKLVSSIALFLALGVMSAAHAATYYVATTGSDSNPGTQAKPFQTIGHAVSVSASGDTVLVADGTYTGAGNVNMDFGGKDRTVKSASGNPAACTIDCQQAGCAFTLHSIETANSLIQGFTITNGTGFPLMLTGGTNIFYGGGIYMINTNPVVNNCILIGNSAGNNGGAGGGMSYGTAINCAFINNSAYRAGGLWRGTAINCVFTGNSVTGVTSEGGGMDYGTATNCVFNGNSATTSGGGGMHYGTATNCVFIGNSAAYGGGTNYCTATNCAFINNSATYGGGSYNGIVTNSAFTGNYASNYGGGTEYGGATNCIFTNNSAAYGGGSYNGEVTNCAFTNNLATYGGGIATSAAINCIVWNNTAPYNPNVYNGSVTYSDVQGGYSGTGNINADPLFVNAATGNLHLSAVSPCIDAGTTTVPNYIILPTTDKDGGKRTIGSAPDIGAYEYGNVGTYGTLIFPGIASNAPPQNVSFQFRPVGGGTTINTTYFTTSDGAFYLYSVPDGSYNLWIKSPAYLAASVPITVTGGVASVPAATLQPGDANNDNVVNTADFNTLVSAFGGTGYNPATGYDLTADFNGDGNIDTADFNLLVGSFGNSGAL